MFAAVGALVVAKLDQSRAMGTTGVWTITVTIVIDIIVAVVCIRVINSVIVADVMVAASCRIVIMMLIIVHVYMAAVDRS